MPANQLVQFAKGELITNTEHTYSVPQHNPPPTGPASNTLLMPPPRRPNLHNKRITLKLPGSGSVTYTNEGLECVLLNKQTLPRQNTGAWSKLVRTKFTHMASMHLNIGDHQLHFTALRIHSDVYSELLSSNMFLMYRKRYFYMCCMVCDIMALRYISTALRSRFATSCDQIIELDD